MSTHQTPALIPLTLAKRLAPLALSAAAKALDDGHYVYALEQTRAAQTSLDVLTRTAVRCARSEGKTWEEIGTALGTTRQAAQQRYGATTL